MPLYFYINICCFPLIVAMGMQYNTNTSMNFGVLLQPKPMPIFLNDTTKYAHI